MTPAGRREGPHHSLGRAASPPALTSGELKRKPRSIWSYGEFPCQAQQIHSFMCNHRRVQAGKRHLSTLRSSPVRARPFTSLLLPKDAQVPRCKQRFPKHPSGVLRPGKAIRGAEPVLHRQGLASFHRDQEGRLFWSDLVRKLLKSA